MKTDRTKIRRKNREVKDEQWIKDYLHTAHFGVFATSVEEQAFLNWNLFIYDEKEHVIYFHTAGTGRTKSNIEKNPNICFSIGDMGEIVLEEKAINFSAQYKSVIIFGKAKIITDEKLLMSVFQLYFKKYAGNLQEGVDYIPFSVEDAKKATLFKLNIDEMSAKMNSDKSYQHNH